METENEARFRNCARMGRHTFELLLRRCKAEGRLKDSKKITSGEKLMIFLYVLSGKSNKERKNDGSIVETQFQKLCTKLRLLYFNCKTRRRRNCGIHT